MVLKLVQQINKTNRVFYCTKSESKNKFYSNTVLLPKTKFPLRLESKKLVERDEYIYNKGDFDNLYMWQRSHLSEPEFVLHDGPPYANGKPHMGHAINKILKDTILRYHILNGNKVHYIPGWDCHGLPIELKAISNSTKMDPIEIRSKARKFAEKTIEKQKEIFKSWGVIGDWKNSYTTYSVDYVKIQFRQFYKMYEKNLIYRDVKPIYWSPSTRTALAEAELEYNENHKSPSAYVRFEVKDIPKIKLLKGKRVYAIIWTTTPWTLPSNQAVCYNESLSYCLVKKPNPQDTDIYIIAAELLEQLSTTFNCNFQLLNVVSGVLLEGTTYAHPIYKEQVLPFLHSSHATQTKGTGLVHTAPAHGPDDFLVALNNKLSIELLEDVKIIPSEKKDSINHQCNLLEQHGTDFWWKLGIKELLPENLCLNLEEIEKGEDIMDIWFDSGISWAKVLDGTKVADMYLEGTDQFTGWFQSALLTSVALRDKAPYKTIYVHGFAVDENGNKMSKSVGNVINPIDITNGKHGKKPYGVDTLRWWATCHANQVSLANVSTNVLQCSADEVQKIRSVLRFALGSLSDYEKSDEDQENLLLIDRYMLHLLYQFHKQVGEFIKEYQFHKISSAVINLLTNPISAIYYTTIKDRLYCDHAESPTRRAAQYTLYRIFEIVLQSVSPIVPHLAEDMYLYLQQKDSNTYFTSTHLKPEPDWDNSKIERMMITIFDIRKHINKKLEAVTIDADVIITFSKKTVNLLKDLIGTQELQYQLVDIFQVSSVTIIEDPILIEDYKLEISKSKKSFLS
ncbi:hypothetical protein NQ314_001881 [Rhamnusium bicolor]|uniref:isoleucine--tRNA ligase n=1 Tax=Rhamnusium bicolor TaxID=1586634 RepID=A0AAV8ZUC9_9CUCU|nr:hypothetical protein NQ314_001881 [Rhamnusium bicolor]